MISWNPWHGCTKYSTGCKNCYVYRMDAQYSKDPTEIKVTNSFDLPLAKNRKKEYKYPSGTVFFTCYTSDFFLPEMKKERLKALEIIKERSDCTFFIITKRIDLVDIEIPDNVELCCTCENQDRYDYRMPIFKKIKAKHKSLCLEPLLTPISLGELADIKLEKIVSGGESGYGSEIRHCKEEWVKDLYEQTKQLGIPFCFKQTGTYFDTLDGRQLNVPRKDQFDMARKFGYQDFEITEL